MECFKNVNTGVIVATSEDELNAYYKRTYDENVKGGYISDNPESDNYCGFEDWVNDDTDITFVEEV